MKDGVYKYKGVSCTVPGYAGVRGSSTNTATVTVNGHTAWWLGEHLISEPLQILMALGSGKLVETRDPPHSLKSIFMALEIRITY